MCPVAHVVGVEYGFFSVCYWYGYGGGGDSLFCLSRKNERLGGKDTGDARRFFAAGGTGFDDFRGVAGIFGQEIK